MEIKKKNVWSIVNWRHLYKQKKIELNEKEINENNFSLVGFWFIFFLLNFFLSVDFFVCTEKSLFIILKSFWYANAIKHVIFVLS